MKKISFEPVWFDSLGAKSSCTLVKTEDISILIDPGAAIMQPSFPASYAKKIYWLEKASVAIRKAKEKADVIVISHYHYDHFKEDPNFYEGKIVLVKNPNEYINDSQRKRAEIFFDSLLRRFKKRSLETFMEKKRGKSYPNPLKELKKACRKDFGDYEKRRTELLQKGMNWFKRRVKKWNSWKKIPEIDCEEVKVKFGDGETFRFGKTKIKFTKPLFHGIEFSRVGWVFSTVVEHEGEKLIHSSDLNGPNIEDYADWIIKEKPNVLILDGPMTYMLGYLLNRINLNRAIDNICRIIERVDMELMILDHHLPREPKFKERLSQVYETARKNKKRVLTAAEFLGKKPKVLEITLSNK